jgi:Flp pilus assembly protein CpaB
VSPETAAGGRIRPGDAVEVLVTTNKGKPEARTTVVLARVMVYDVGYADRQLSVGTGSNSADPAALAGALRSVTLAVTEQEAIALAQARWSGELDVALLAANQSAAGQPSGGQ